MGALYIIGAVVAAGVVTELAAKLMRSTNNEPEDYHFAMGVGAVFGERGFQA